MESGKTKGFHGHGEGIKTFCLVLARGGSKGIPHKNIYPIHGKPMIVYTIEEALKSKYIDAVFVSTDDEQIASVAKEHGAEIIIRPQDLSEDSTPSAVSAIHSLKEIGRHRRDAFFVMLQCTSPLRKYEDIDAAIEKYMSRETKCLASVSLAEHHPLKTFMVNSNDQVVLLGKPEEFEMPRQQLDAAYRFNGAIYIRDIEDFFIDTRFVTIPFSYYVMEKSRSMDVDDLVDIKYAEFMIEQSWTKGEM